MFSFEDRNTLITADTLEFLPYFGFDVLSINIRTWDMFHRSSTVLCEGLHLKNPQTCSVTFKSINFGICKSNPREIKSKRFVLISSLDHMTDIVVSNDSKGLKCRKVGQSILLYEVSKTTFTLCLTKWDDYTTKCW